jgi:hypothetical protein
MTVHPNPDGTLPADEAVALAAYGRATNPETAALISQARAQVVPCADCGEPRPAKHIDPSTGLCGPCYDRAGLENSHADGHHATDPDPECPDCIEAHSTAVTVDLALDSLEVSICHLQGLPGGAQLTAGQNERLAALLEALTEATEDVAFLTLASVWWGTAR